MTFTIWFIVLALATWRITSLFVNEAGPFGVFAKLRYAIGVRYDDYSKPYGNNIVANAFVCVWCLSIWVSLVAAIFLFPHIVWWQYPIAVLALSAVAITIDELIGG